jgi:hypothetical protein
MTRADSLARPGTRATRRALVGAAWALAWTLVWGCMLMMFAHRAHASLRLDPSLVVTMQGAARGAAATAGVAPSGVAGLRVIYPLHHAGAAAVGIVK